MSKFSAALNWAEKLGINVTRYNLSQEPSAFVKNTIVCDTMDSDGMDCLPLIIAEEKIISKGI